MRAILLTLILLSASLARAEAQAPMPTPGVSLLSYTAYGRLADPCEGIIRAMRTAGINPGSFSPAAQALRRRAYAVLLPVLVDLATNPGQSADPELLDERMAAQVATALTGTGLYTPQRLLAVQQPLVDALTASPPSDGAGVVRAILTDPVFGPPWLAALTNAQGTDAVTCDANRRPVW